MSDQEQAATPLSPFNPYVGPRPFQRGEVLYGRSYEQRDLLDLLIAERIVLFHSPSGAGKTSLIQAGLIPDLEAADFSVLPVMRLNQELPPNPLANGDGVAANRYVLSALLALEAGAPPETRRSPAELLDLSIEDYLSTSPQSAEPLANVVLIIDQFEEILTIDPANIAAKNAFFAQLGTALRNRSRWLLCSMREDHIGGLDPYVRLVPTRLDTRFRLELLDVESARLAVAQPANDAGRPFEPAFVQHMLDDLRQTSIQRPDGIEASVLGPFVEPVHLQVVFRRLWEQGQRGDGQVEPSASTRSNVDDALEEYYDQEVVAAAERTGVAERAIREWFDHKLIVGDGIRNQVRQGPTQSDGLDNSAIKELVDSHLVRSEPRLGATWFELAHDRLVKPIRASNAAWIDNNLSLLQRQALVWNRQERPSGMLLRDEALAEAEQWAAAHADILSDDERSFLQQCQQARAERQREVEYTRLQELNYHRARLTIALLILVIAIIGGVGWYIFRQERAARVRNLAALAREAPERFPQKSALGAVEAVHLSQKYGLAQSAAEQSLHTTLASIGGTPLLGHTGPVNAVAFQPRGQLLATGSTDGTVRLWDTQAPRHATAALRGHALGIATLAFSQDGTLLASGAYDGSARVWQIEAPERPSTVLGGHNLAVNALAFSPDGKLLATGDFTGTARLWQLDAPQQPIAILQSSPTRDLSAVTNLVFAFSADGTLLAIGGSDGQLQLVQTSPLSKTATILRESGASVTALAFSPEAATLAASRSDGTVLLWDMPANGGQPTQLGEANFQAAETISVFAFSSDGKMLATGGSNGTVSLWRDIGNDTPTVLDKHKQRVSALAFSNNGQFLASASDDGTAQVWSIGASAGGAATLQGHEASVRALAFSDDDRYVATGSDDATARLWAVNAPQSEPTLLRAHTSEVRSVAFSSDATALVSTSADGTALRWEGIDAVPQPTVARNSTASFPPIMAVSPNMQWLATVEFSKTVELRDLGVPNAQPIPAGSTRSIPNMGLFSSDSGLFAAGGSDGISGTVQLWRTDAPQNPPLDLDSGGWGNVALAFSPDGQRLATGSSDGIVRLWRTDTQAPSLAEVRDETKATVEALAFNQDGSLLASGSVDGTVRLWRPNASQSTTSTVLLRQDPKVSTLAFSRNGTRLAIGYEDGTVWLWNATTTQGAPIKLPGGHTARVNTIAFSPDENLLASGSEDTTVHLWQLDAPNVEPVVLRGHEGIILALAFSPDSRYLATGSQDMTVGLWRLQIDDLVERACAAAGRNLSVQELQGFGLASDADTQKTCAELPVHPSVYTNLLLNDELDKALAIYTAEHLEDPTLEPPAAWLVRQAAELLQRGQQDRALELYHRAQQIDTQLDTVRVNALNQFCLTGTSERHAEALDACTRAVELAPENADYRFNRGFVRREAGDPAGAIQDFEKFLEIATGQPNAGENLPKARQWIEEMQEELRATPTPSP